MNVFFTPLFFLLTPLCFFASACGNGGAPSSSPTPENSTPPPRTGETAPPESPGSSNQNPQAAPDSRALAAGEVLDFSGHKFKVLSSNSLRISKTPIQTQVSGSGTLVAFNPVREGVSSSNRYDFRFGLKNSGAVKIKMHGNADLSGAMELEFLNSDNRFNVSLLISSQRVDLSQFFLSQNPTSSLGFSIDLHNGESPAHVLVWALDLVSARLPTNALLNTTADKIAVPGEGTGAFWGVELVNSELTSAGVGSPNFIHRH